MKLPRTKEIYVAKILTTYSNCFAKISTRRELNNLSVFCHRVSTVAQHMAFTVAFLEQINVIMIRLRYFTMFYITKYCKLLKVNIIT